jgi:hypothetical protein
MLTAHIALGRNIYTLAFLFKALIAAVYFGNTKRLKQRQYACE